VKRREQTCDWCFGGRCPWLEFILVPSADRPRISSEHALIDIAASKPDAIEVLKLEWEQLWLYILIFRPLFIL